MLRIETGYEVLSRVVEHARKNKPNEIEMVEEITPPDDDHQIRCRKLGHLIYFSYCRKENDGLPCAKTLDCWYPFFRVEEFLRDELTPEEFAKAFARPQKPKVLSLVELIEKAQKNIKK